MRLSILNSGVLAMKSGLKPEKSRDDSAASFCVEGVVSLRTSQSAHFPYWGIVECWDGS